MNKKSAKRRRKNLITKLAMTSALTLGVGAATTMTGQTEVRANTLVLNMEDKDAVKKFADELKQYAEKGQHSQITWQKLSLILDGYKNIRDKIEKDLAATEATKNLYGTQLARTEQAYQSEKAKKEKLEAELQENQQKIQELNAQVDGATKEKQDLQEQLSKEKKAKNAEIAALQEQLEASNQKAQALEAEKAALQEKLAMQEQAHAEEKAKLQKEIDELNAQLEKLKHCQDTPKPEQPKPEQPKPMTKPGAKKSEQSLPSTGDIRNPFFTPAAIAIMIAAGTIAIPKRKKED